jgi:hypothetical protein
VRDESAQQIDAAGAIRSSDRLFATGVDSLSRFYTAWPSGDSGEGTKGLGIENLFASDSLGGWSQLCNTYSER